MLAVIQLDAVSVPLLDRLLGQGRLPELAALREEGTWEPLATTATHFPAATYPTLYSGLDVGDHGRTYAMLWAAGEQRVRFRSSFPAPLTAWDRLAAAGRRTLAIDPYELERPAHANGLVVSGWQFRNVLGLERWIAPADAPEDVKRRLRRSPLVQEVFGDASLTLLSDSRKTLLTAAERPADLAVEQLCQTPYDLVWITLLAGHLGGHLFWDLSNLGGADETARRELEGTLPELYEALDRALGRVVRALPDDTDLVVVSPMGMGPNATIVDLLPAMLEAVLGTRRAAQPRPRGERLLWRARAAVPVRGRAAISRALGGAGTRVLTTRLSTAGVDWSRTRAFMLPSDHFGQVRLNVRGRERDGIVPPAAVDDLVDELREGLLSFRHGDGTPVVAAVDRSVDVVEGTELIDLLPDLVVRWTDRPAAEVHSIASDGFGEILRPGGGSGRSGAHTADAWALTVARNRRLRAHDGPRHVRDIAATACVAAGVDPGRMRGSSLLE